MMKTRQSSQTSDIVTLTTRSILAYNTLIIYLNEANIGILTVIIHINQTLDCISSPRGF